MAYKKTNSLGGMAIALTVMLSLLGSNILPVLMPRTVPRAQAAGIPVIDIPAWVERGLDIVAMSIAKRLIDDIVRSTVEWANDGFDGNPAYPADWGRTLEQTAKGAAGQYILDDTKLGFLCSPFQAQIKLALIQANTEPAKPFECTLDDIGVNYDAFINDFQTDGGGWEAWIEITQKDQNNPYGAYLATAADLRKDVAKQLGLQNQERELGSGFLSYRGCAIVQPDVPPTLLAAYHNGDPGAEVEIASSYPDYTPGFDPGECIKPGPVRTPGSIIEGQLQNSFASGLNKLITADQWNELASALVTGLVNRVFSERGLFSDNTDTYLDNSAAVGLDLDDDGIPDGDDYDDDGNLDLCHHGRIDQSQDPSNENCFKSSELTNSPYFVSLCRELQPAINSVERYQEFLQEYVFNRLHARTWLNRTIRAQDSVDSLIRTLERYEIMAYDTTLFALGRYSDYLDDRIESLMADGDLVGSSPLGDPWEEDLLEDLTDETLTFLIDFKEAVGQCDNPNTEAVSNLPPPSTEEPDPNEPPDSSNPPSTPSQPPAPTLSCSPSTDTAQPNQLIVWSTESTYPTGTLYQWVDEDISPQPQVDFAPSLEISYLTEGIKNLSIVATLESGAVITMPCSPSVVVSTSPAQ